MRQPSTRRDRPGRRTTPPLGIGLAVLAVLAAGALVATALVDDLVGVGADPPAADGAVELERPETTPEAAGSGPMVCTHVDEDGPCGATLVDDPTRVGDVRPLGSDGVVVADPGGRLSRLGIPGAVAQWTVRPLPGSGRLAVEVSGDVVLALHDGRVARVDARTGEVRWRTRVDDPGRQASARAWVVDDGVLVLDDEGLLTALDLTDGERLWQTSVPQAQPVPTAAGVLILRRGETVLWHPRDGAVWERADLLEASWSSSVTERAQGPLPLWQGGGLTAPTVRQSLIDPATGATVGEVPEGRATAHVVDEVTLQLQWGDDGVLALTAYGPGGEVWWHRPEPAVPCCTPRVVAAGEGRVAVAPRDDRGVLLATADGAELAELVPPGDARGTLVGVAGRLALWRTRDGIVGTSFDGDERHLEVRSGVELAALEPLLFRDEAGAVMSAEALTGRVSGDGVPNRHHALPSAR